MKLVFMLEETSMKVTLDILLPKILPKDIAFQTIPHEGKSDLEKSIPRKLRAWREPDVRFIIIRDNDGGDCKLLKQHLVDLCTSSGRSDSIIRIVCQELECWFLGDLAAVENAYNLSGLAAQQQIARFRDPDQLGNASQILKNKIAGYGKIMAAKAIAPHMNIDNNKSNSFNLLIETLRHIS